MTDAVSYRHGRSRRSHHDYYDQYSSPTRASRAGTRRYRAYGDEYRPPRVPSPPPSPPPLYSSSYPKRRRRRTEPYHDDRQSRRKSGYREPTEEQRHSPRHDESPTRARERQDTQRHHYPARRSRRRHRRHHHSIATAILVALMYGLVYMVEKAREKVHSRRTNEMPFAYREQRPAAVPDDEEAEDFLEYADSDSDSDSNSYHEHRLSLMSGAIPVAAAVGSHQMSNTEVGDPMRHRARGEGSSGPDRECIVCGEEQPANEFLWHITSRCEHEVSTCRACLAQWIRTSLESRAWNDIRCAECRQICQYEDIIRIAPLDIVDAIDSQSARTVLSQIPDFYWCTSLACNSGQIHVNPEDPIMNCGHCGTRSCIVHNIPWHEGESCAEYTYRHSPRVKRREERASEKLVNKIAKPCPGPGCGARIQKTYGCDHMTCRQCNHEFCWICLASYERIRTIGYLAHERTCRYHVMNV